MNAISQPPCMTQVKALVPMRMSYFMQLHAAHLCALGVPASVVATIVMELQLGKDDADTKDQKARQRRERLAAAVLSGTKDTKEIETASAGLVTPEADWRVWQEIVNWIWQHHPDLAPAMLAWLYELFCEGALETLDDAIQIVETNEPGYRPSRHGLK